jgi:putative polyhydroxyalkanoate system protein
MPKLNIERSHTLDAATVKTRLQGLSDKLAAKYGLTSTWKSDTEAEVKGTGATGKITCSTNKVSVMIDLSFALSMMKGKIEEKVQKELDAALA